MFTCPHENRHGFRVAALLSAIWFALFVVLVPVFHRHAGEWRAGLTAASVASAVNHGEKDSRRVAAASASGASAFVSLSESRGLTPLTDDCPLCQWFGVGFTPPCLVALLLIAAALVTLLFDVRLTELCRRPLPRRGLRAPPGAPADPPQPSVPTASPFAPLPRLAISFALTRLLA